MILGASPAKCNQTVQPVQNEKVAEPSEAKSGLLRSDKENRPNQEKHQAVKTSAMWTLMREVEQLKEQLANEERLRAQAEDLAGVGRSVKKTAAKDFEDLQLRYNDLETMYKDSCKKARDQETFANLSKRMLDGKEQAMTALQKDMSLAQEELAELRTKLNDSDGALGDMEMLRKENFKLRTDSSTLRAKLMAFESQEDVEDVSVQTEAVQLATEQRSSGVPVFDIKKYLPLIHQQVDVELRRRMAGFGAQMTELSSDIDNLRSATERNEHLFQDSQCRDEELESLRADVEEMSLCLQKAREDLEIEQRKSKEMETSLQTARETMQQQKEDTCAEAEELRVQLNEAHEQLQCKQKDASSEAGQTNASLQRACADLQDQQQEMAALKAKHSEQSAELQNLSAQNEMQAAELQSLTSEKAQMASELQELRTAVQEKAKREAVFQDLDSDGRNRELLETVEEFRHECEMLEVENRSLRDTVTTFEENLDRVAGQHAKLLGHVNHKQKIKYTLKLKEENVRLYEEATKLRKQVHRLQASQRVSICDSLPSFNKSKTPRARSASARGSLPSKPEAANQAQERTIEGMMQDILHLRALIERAIDMDEPCGQGSDMTTLIQRLRRVVAERHSSRHGKVASAPGSAATSRATSPRRMAAPSGVASAATSRATSPRSPRR